MNHKLDELFEQAGGSFGNDGEPILPDIEVFAELIVKDCMAICDELKVEYFNHRKNTMDFDEKHIYAEGESACFNLRYKMKKRFGVEG